MHGLLLLFWSSHTLSVHLCFFRLSFQVRRQLESSNRLLRSFTKHLRSLILLSTLLAIATLRRVSIQSSSPTPLSIRWLLALWRFSSLLLHTTLLHAATLILWIACLFLNLNKFLCLCLCLCRIRWSCESTLCAKLKLPLQLLLSFFLLLLLRRHVPLQVIQLCRHWCNLSLLLTLLLFQSTT